MAATDTSAFPVKNQAYRLTGCIKSFANGNPLTGGLTALTATVSKDGGAFAGTSNSATEIGTSGYFYLDLTATEMNANTVTINVTASNTNAITASLLITPIDLTETTTHWMGQTTKRLEQGVLQGASYLLNQVQENGSAITMYKFNSSTTYLTSTIVNAGTLSATKGQMG